MLNDSDIAPSPELEEKLEEKPPRPRSRDLVAQLKRHLTAIDAEACLSVCQWLCDLYDQADEPHNAAVFADIFGANFILKQNLRNFPHHDRRLLVEAMFQLSKTVLQYPKIKPEDRFLANYNFYWCAKNYPTILQQSDRATEVKIALQEALAGADFLIPTVNRDGTFRSQRLSSYSFWHRVAQLHLARWTLGLATPEELPADLETAVAALKRIVNFGVGMSALAVQHNQAKLAGCLDWLAMLYAEKQQWRRSNLYYMEADRWFSEITQTEPEKPRICRNAFLAEFYFGQQEFSLAYEHALVAVADDTANRVAELRQGSFHYFLDRLLIFRGADPTDFLLDLIATGLPPIANLMALSALALNSAMRGDWSYVETARSLVLIGAEQLGIPEVMAIPSEYRHLLVTTGPAMMDFVRESESRISGGEAESQIDLLTKLVAGSKAISFDLREDVVLLSLLAQAHARVGDYETALPLFGILLTIDASNENRSRTLYQLGDVYLARGELERAIHYYESSYRISHHRAALFKAALARTSAGQFARGIDHLQKLLAPENSNRDAYPHQTRTVLAQAYWGRYCLDEELGGKNDADVEAACEALREVLTGKVGPQYVQDAEAIARFVDMISHPTAATAIAEFLRKCWDSGQVILFSNALGRRHAYPRLIIEVALERLADAKLWDEVKRGFVRILAKALARAYHYGETDGLSFKELASLIVTQFQQLPSVDHQQWLCELLLLEQHASKSELIERYADEAIKLFAPISGTPEDAIKALGDPAVLTPINDFLRHRMPPATEPIGYGHTDSADLYELTCELIDELRDEFQEPMTQGSILALPRRSGSAAVSLMDWLDRIRPFLLNLLDIPRHIHDYSAHGPLAPLAAEASPWSIYSEVDGSSIEIILRFNQIDPGRNPTLLLAQAEQWLKTQCELPAVKDLIQLDLWRLESDHRVKITVTVPRPVQISLEFAQMNAFVNFMKHQALRMLTGRLPDPVSYLRGPTLFASAFQHVRHTETEKWVEFIRHLLDVRYVMAASWLLFLPLEGGDTGKHPRSVVHHLKNKVRFAMQKQEKGNEVTREELAELKSAQFRLAANILFASRDNFSSMPRIWLKGVITRVVNEFSKLPDLQFSVFCPPDAYARIHRELFSRVMFDLLHNAITAAVATETPLVEVRVAKDEPPWLKISVMNKYNPELPGSETGSGIGLKEVRYFIGMSNGEVRVREDKDRGEFEVLLLLPDLTNGPSVSETL